MRSRYSAFALGHVDYLWRTLHPDHTDRERPEAEVRRELLSMSRSNRFTGLQIWDHDEVEGGGDAQVLFRAGIFQKGKDYSFVELSEFRQVNSAWRYLSGQSLPADVVAGPLTIDLFPGVFAKLRDAD